LALLTVRKEHALQGFLGSKEAGYVARVILEIDAQLYRMLKASAETNQVSLEEECCRRLAGGERRSRYLQALVAELRAEDEQRRANSR
jgi:hypothetical protein